MDKFMVEQKQKYDQIDRWNMEPGTIWTAERKCRYRYRMDGKTEETIRGLIMNARQKRSSLRKFTEFAAIELCGNFLRLQKTPKIRQQEQWEPESI